MKRRPIVLFAMLAPFFFAFCGSGGSSDNGADKKDKGFVPNDSLILSYIKAEQEIQPLRTHAKRDVIDMVAKRDMELQRFMELDQAKDPSSLEQPIKKKEKRVLRKIRKERKEIYDSKASGMKRRAEAQGLEWQQYERIRNAIRQKGTAQDRFKEMRDSLGVDLPLPPSKKPAYMP